MRDEDLAWDRLPLDEVSVVAAAADTSGVTLEDRDALVVFPRICIAKEDDMEPLSAGTLLTKSQTVTAAREMDTERTSHRKAGRLVSVRETDRKAFAAAGTTNLHDRGGKQTFLGQSHPDDLQSGLKGDSGA